MDKNNLFIFVTRNGAIFDRTNGKNERIIFGRVYNALNGSVSFVKDDNESIVLTRSSSSGKIAYKKELSKAGMYVVTPMFVQPLPQTSKEVRIMYNKIKNLLGSPKFKIIEDSTFDEPLKIQFNIKNDEGVLESRFIIKINTDKVCYNDIEKACDLVQRSSALDVQILIRNFQVLNQREIIFTINDEFIETALVIEQHFKTKNQ